MLVVPYLQRLFTYQIAPNHLIPALQDLNGFEENGQLYQRIS